MTLKACCSLRPRQAQEATRLFMTKFEMFPPGNWGNSGHRPIQSEPLHALCIQYGCMHFSGSWQDYREHNGHATPVPCGQTWTRTRSTSSKQPSLWDNTSTETPAHTHTHTLHLAATSTPSLASFYHSSNSLSKRENQQTEGTDI